MLFMLCFYQNEKKWQDTKRCRMGYEVGVLYEGESASEMVRNQRERDVQENA
jgi:hypothetical protein